MEDSNSKVNSAPQKEKTNNITDKSSRIWYKRWWGILIVLFIWPYFLLWYTWRKASWHKGVKIAVTAVVSFLLIGVAASGQEPQNSNIKNANTQAPATTSNATPQQAEEPEPTPEDDIEEFKSSEAYKNPIQVPYAELFRNSEKYTGKYVKLTGEVIQVTGEPGEWNLRVDVTAKGEGEYVYYSDTVFVESASQERVIENDIIEFTGLSMGVHTYESVMGGEITIPYLLIVEHKLVGRND